MIRAVILLTLAACASSKSAEQHAEVGLEAHGEQQATQSVQQETHSEEGGWTRRTWEFVGPVSAGSDSQERVPAPVPGVAPAADTGHPSFLGWPMDGDAPLLRYTEETHAPAHVDTSTLAQSASGAEQQTTLQANSASKSASKRSYWPPVTYLIVGLLAAAAGLWLARGKLKLALGVLGRIF